MTSKCNHILRGLNERFRWFLAPLFLLLLNSTIATSLNPLTLKQLYKHSDLIVIAQVSQVKIFTKNNTVYSSYSLQVEEYLKGSGTSALSLHQLGGKTKLFHTLISGIRQYEPQDRVVLFLNSDEQGQLDTLGYAQGSIILDNQSLIFDNYHFFIAPSSTNQLPVSSKEYRLHKELETNKNLSNLKELIKLYAS
ncbi:MAG: hypothetical protein KC646_17055 [Candidatus Cloacimonetes bacterium]|nr:hypothetical protein [Candidatus Cloacimonadota bacterium]